MNSPSTPWPDPSILYFWPAVNKRCDPSLTGIFLPDENKIFWPKRKKNGISRGNFPNTELTRATKNDPIQPRSKFLDPDPSSTSAFDHILATNNHMISIYKSTFWIKKLSIIIFLFQKSWKTQSNSGCKWDQRRRPCWKRKSWNYRWIK